MPIRNRRYPRKPLSSRVARLAGSPMLPPKTDEPSEEKPKKRTRKRSQPKEVEDE